MAPPKFEVFYDGLCPLCRREIEMIRRMDKHMQIKLINIAHAKFVPCENGPTLEQMMRAMHGRFPGDGQRPDRWITGVDVFREIYGRLGFKRTVGMSRLPMVNGGLNVAYQVFAFFRYRSALRRMKKRSTSSACPGDRCRPLGLPEMNSVPTEQVRQ